jgi:N6-L-threonylcarbamoyladenine synthase
MKILAIETSCDETAVAIIDENKNILSHILNSQIKLHQEYGGVIPELAARSHAEILDELIILALKEANLELNEIDAFAATSGPGLIGGVIVGMVAAKTLAAVFAKPFLAINHLEGHALTARLTNNLNYPFLLLLISGGHCQIINVKDFGNYQKIGETIDDALGEAFDKVAQMLGLPYPGGPALEKLAKEGNENRFNFSKPLIHDKNHLFNFSFSGLKTAVRREIEKLINEDFSHLTSITKIQQKDKADIAASFQKVVCQILINRLENVVNLQLKDAPKNVVIAGGVAANKYIFAKLDDWAKTRNLNLIAPPIKFCTDNAAMIAWVGIEKMLAGQVDSLDFKPKSRWSL